MLVLGHEKVAVGLGFHDVRSGLLDDLQRRSVIGEPSERLGLYSGDGDFAREALLHAGRQCSAIEIDARDVRGMEQLFEAPSVVGCGWFGRVRIEADKTDAHAAS